MTRVLRKVRTCSDSPEMEGRNKYESEIIIYFIIIYLKDS